MKKGIFKMMLVICGLIIVNTASAQISDTVSNICARHLESQFISDGQQYKALLMNSDETAEFHTTLYGGTVYRIAACSGLNDGNLIFSVYDTERNLLFTNSEFKNAPYWDFKIKNSLDCVIEAKLNGSAAGSGRAVVLIGFKQQK
ncbi:MAG: hypothetical protein A3F72_06795 [Bacteroidetes bacterium RIFCSPLOWO2_12_FULL_35_15]|nr:MAG: hypothetical protein A3F72_06795 [Bacteroidetes bacterium RIFCSPLOWO2_12_FULL_35_15]